MPPERKRLIGLLATLGVLAVVVLVQYWPATPAAVAQRRAGTPANRSTAAGAITAPDVHLQALEAERPRPEGDPERNLFRFRPKAPPPRPATPVKPPAAPPTQVAGPPPAPALAPITMRFIGLMEATEHAQKIAVLTDGRGIYQGREGDIIEGRYRILKIGIESVEMAYLDGRGRQTIRLSGS